MLLLFLLLSLPGWHWQEMVNLFLLLISVDQISCSIYLPLALSLSVSDIHPFPPANCIPLQLVQLLA